MWLIILLFTFVSARPQNRDIFDQNIHHLPPSGSGQTTTPAAIIAQYDINSPDGSFNNSYETSNGIKVANAGYYKRIKIPRYEDVNGKVYDEHEEDILVQTGSYSYFDPEGNIITLEYLADENGFQPIGSHIPTLSPPTNNLTNQHLVQDRPIQQQRPSSGFVPAQAGLIQQRRPSIGFDQNRPIILN